MPLEPVTILLVRRTIAILEKIGATAGIERSHGDYSKERHEIFASLTMEELASSIESEARQTPPSEP